MNARRTKEPEAAAGTLFAAVIDAARAMLKGFAGTIQEEADEGAKEFIRGKIEGIESVILLCQRAARGEIGPMRVAPPAAAPATELEARVAQLEKDVHRLSFGKLAVPGSVPSPKPRALPTLLKAGTKSDDLTRCEKTLLGVLVGRSERPTTSAQLAILSGYSLRSSSFQASVSVLRARGMIEARGAGSFVATERGRESLPVGWMKTFPTGKALVDLWAGLLGRQEAAMLRAVAAGGPAGISDRQELAAMAGGYSTTSSAFDQSLRHLRVLDLVTDAFPLRLTPIFEEA